MSTSDVVSGLIRELKETGLADMPGRLLYSGLGTLAPGKLYVLGYNPGGDPDAESDSSADHLAKLDGKSLDWNEYIDGVWRPGGRVCAPGDAPMQRRVCHLLTGIGLRVRTVCASNVIFVRSRASSGLDNQAQLAERCWSVHQFILEHIRPEGILSIGGAPVFDFVCSRGRPLSAPEQFQAGHVTWACLAARVQLGAQNMAIVSVPHLARYAIDRHPEVVRWVCTMLEL
jgi:hypothetical protein